VTTKVLYRPKRGAVMVSVAAAIIMLSASWAFAGLDDPAYKEGFGKDAAGGAGKPTYIVTSSAATGPGSLLGVIYSPWTGQNLIQNVNIVFAVDTFTTDQPLYIGSNVTIDGCANGKNGVVFDHGGVGDVNGKPSQPPKHRGVVLREGSNNVIIRCLNFIGYGWPSIENTDPTHAQPEYNFIWLAVGSDSPGGTISNVLIDRNTFTRATNKAFDVTSGGGLSGKTRNVTFQRNLLHDNALGSHIKYADGVNFVRENISYHHNVFAHGGERQPQIVDNVGPFDYVNNIVYTNSGDVPKYPDGGDVSPYGLRVWNTSAAGQATRFGASGDPFSGNVTVNVVANAFLGNAGNIVILTDTSISGDIAPASNAGNYVSADNYFNPATNAPVLISMNSGAQSRPSLPWNTPNAIPTGYQITTLPVTQLKSQMLPYVGAPSRTALDQQRLNEVAAQLPGASAPPPPSNLKIQ
jgi:pectate lyase